MASKAELGTDQRDRMLPDLGRANCLGLPCRELQGVGGVLHCGRSCVLQVIESRGASHLETYQAKDK